MGRKIRFLLLGVLSIGLESNNRLSFAQDRSLTPVLSVEELAALRKGGVKTHLVVDVRSAQEFAGGHIEGAVHAAYGQIGDGWLPKEGKLVLYCGGEGCPLSAMAARTLEGLGYTDVWVLKGGIQAWEARGYRVVSSLGNAHASGRRAMKLRPASLKSLRARVQDRKSGILDVRSLEEYEAGHLPGARHVALEELKERAGQLGKNKEWIVYDRHPQRAREAALALEEAGVRARIFSGSLAVWAATGNSMEVGSE